jgi:hypothetical protein
MAATNITGSFVSNKYYKSLAAGEKAVYVYKPSATSNNRGAQFYISLDGATASDLVPMVVKWDDRSAVQGYCNQQWAPTIHGPVDFVIDNTNDSSASYYEFV